MEKINRDKLLLEVASWCVEQDQQGSNTHTNNIKELVRAIMREDINVAENAHPVFQGILNKHFNQK